MTYANPQTVDPAVLEDYEGETPEEVLARDLAAGVDSSPARNQVGQKAAESVAPDQDKLDEGDMEDYDQEELARQNAKDAAKKKA